MSAHTIGGEVPDQSIRNFISRFFMRAPGRPPRHEKPPRRIKVLWTFAKSLSLFAAALAALICAENVLLQRLGSATIATLSDTFISSWRPVEDRSAVVIFDGTERDIDVGWPLGYARWERMALTAYCAGARVLVFDIGFSLRNSAVADGALGSQGHFATTIAALSGHPDEPSSRAVRSELFKQNCKNVRGATAEGQTGRLASTVMPIFIAAVPGGYKSPILQEMAVDVSWAKTKPIPLRAATIFLMPGYRRRKHGAVQEGAPRAAIS